MQLLRYFPEHIRFSITFFLGIHCSRVINELQQRWCPAAAAVFLVGAERKIVSGHSVIHPLRINIQHLRPQGEQNIRSTSRLLREGESDGGKTHSSAFAWGEINSVWGWAGYTHVCKSTPPRRWANSHGGDLSPLSPSASCHVSVPV